ncbi:MAG: 4Fe-4S dicluster domain-containing protein [Candidatus Lokiarchaeota archaeon]|nr:4Fe-4S dicluster domain-containing protein [Candidatus Lokiarchaeota archaeon]
MKRTIIKIDEEKCTGCGQCIPNCPEGALQIIDGKAKLVNELHCDGLGACIGYCPEGAITTEVREAKEYDEKEVMENIVKQGKETIIEHLRHLKRHNETTLLQQAHEFLKERDIIELPKESLNERSENKRPCNQETPEKHTKSKFGGCPSARAIDRTLKQAQDEKVEHELARESKLSKLRNWPIQINLVPLQASYYEGGELIVIADCALAAIPRLHDLYLDKKTLLIGCPKLDNAQFYIEKLSRICELNEIKSINVVMMEVPCCSGLKYIIEQSLKNAKKENKIPIKCEIISIDGKIRE